VLSFNFLERSKSEMTAPQPQFIVNDKGKKTGVLLSVKEYQKLMEDLNDLAIVAERRDEAPITLEEMKQRLEDDCFI
jgi:PHD/YefM family antitoxin component YafN of YafNO toxin-antitoxin module